jgi:hypothetical protein
LFAVASFLELASVTGTGSRRPGDYLLAMSDEGPSAARARLLTALSAAREAGRGVPLTLEDDVRTFARLSREAGRSVSELLIEVKEIVRAQTGTDEPLFTPKVVGWAVAGYFSGSKPA